ncbi:MAG: methylmalonyl-CoA mutase, partial [Acidobacteria bacterium]
MADDLAQLFQPFPPATMADWRRLVIAEMGEEGLARLSTRLREEIEVKPLYGPEDALPEGPWPGCPPYTRGAAAAAWRVGQLYDRGDVAAAHAALRRDVAGGARLLWLRLAAAGEPGIRLETAAELAELVAGVDLSEVAVLIDAGGATPAAAALWLAHLERSGVAKQALYGGLACDPTAALARRGVLQGDLDDHWREIAGVARWLGREAPGLRAVLISTLPYHRAGATAVEELALALAGGTDALRRLTAAGLSVDDACRQLRFAFATGGDLFLEIAKLRAARLLWAKVTRACGAGAAAQYAPLYARTSPATKARRSPWTNQLRLSVETLGAVLGGAEAVVTGRWDELLRRDDGASARLALNTQHVLAYEAFFGRVADPAGGSWYVERLTDELARAAWRRFQAVERSGGIVAGLLDGSLAARLAEQAAAKERAVALRRDPLIGVSAFAHPAETPPPAAPAEAG